MKNVDWTKWSAIAEVVSSAAILLTLVYLAIQTQQNTDAILANGRQTALQTELDFLSDTFAYPEIYIGELVNVDDDRDYLTTILT